MPESDAFLLTNNPARWEIDPAFMTGWVEATANGHQVEERWSTGTTTKRIKIGDRAFLLRQGTDGRGIFASGRFITEVFQAEHWDGSGGIANYADVLWDTAVEPEDRLPIEILFSSLPEGQWEPQASGNQIKPEVVDRLEQVWAKHVAVVRKSTLDPAGQSRPRNAGQGRRLDAKLRKEIEDLAQERLMRAYEDDGWAVEDMRIGNSFDARATKDGATCYLEAKGTTTTGERVIVTRREVRWAKEHPGECVIGIVSGITLRADGTLDPESGTLREYDWDADDDDLDPIEFDFRPRASSLIAEH